MRIFAFVVLASCYAATCFAQAPAATPKPMTSATLPSGSMMKGKVKSVSFADAVKGTKSEIAVIDDKGQVSSFLVKGTTTIYDPEFKAISLDKLKVDAGVKVKFVTTKEGVREASSVSEIK